MDWQHLKFTKEHEWVSLDEGTAVVGISDYAQKSLGDITYVDLPEIGTGVAQFQEVAVVESVKAASDIYAPLAGEVCEVNAALADDPGLINRSPYDQGWLFKMTDIDLSGLDQLLDAAAYESYVAGLG
ncbi:MAG: glycine cleavage system protein GcvH [Deltaproteobacteria bacterium]|nr:glycine cleavage system protein GcvH [Deltaproteobacteria bacterium]